MARYLTPSLFAALRVSMISVFVETSLTTKGNFFPKSAKPPSCVATSRPTQTKCKFPGRPHQRTADLLTTNWQMNMILVRHENHFFIEIWLCWSLMNGYEQYKQEWFVLIRTQYLSSGPWWIASIKNFFWLDKRVAKSRLFVCLLEMGALLQTRSRSTGPLEAKTFCTV